MDKIIAAFALILIASSVWANQETNCGPLVPRLSSELHPCLKVERPGLPVINNGLESNFYIPKSGFLGDPKYEELLERLISNTQTILKTLSRFGIIPQTHFFVSTKASPEASLADALVETSGVCTVIFYNNMLEASEKLVQSAMAHEIAHCLQGATIINPSKNPESDGFNRWWQEGLADYLGNVVYPTNNDEYGFAPTFESDIPLFMQPKPYSTSIFFQFLENVGLTANQMIDSLKGVSTAKSYDELRNLLQSFQDMPIYLHLFAQRVVDKRISDTSGALHSALPNFKIDILPLPPGEETITFNSKAFAVQYIDIPITQEADYEVTVEPDGETENLLNVSMKQYSEGNLGAGSWFNMKDRGFPYRLSVNCNDKKVKVIRFAYTSTQASDIPISFKVTIKAVKAKECKCRSATAIIDPCLKGRWLYDNKRVEGIIRQSTPPGTTVELTGDILFNINTGSSKTSVKYDGFTRTTKSMNGPPMRDRRGRIPPRGEPTPLKLIDKLYANLEVTVKQLSQDQVCLTIESGDGYAISQIDSPSIPTGPDINTYEPPLGYGEPVNYKCKSKELDFDYSNTAGDIPLPEELQHDYFIK